MVAAVANLALFSPSSSDRVNLRLCPGAMCVWVVLLCREAQSLDCVDFFPSACSCEEGTVCENSARDEDDFFFKDE